MMRNAVVLVSVVVLAACGGRDAVPAMDSPGPALVVERFLQAANMNDLQTMTQLFGRSNRTIDQLESRERAETRMQVLASLLRHEDYTIQGQRAVPGRINDATELLVELKFPDRTVVVPHLVVRRRSGGWIIERIDIEVLTTRDAAHRSRSSIRTPPVARG
jgi:hypothetical protein